MKNTYLKRGIIVLLLWLSIIGYALFIAQTEKGNQYIWIVFIPMIILTIMMGKSIMNFLTDVTGFNFFFSGVGLLFYYIFILFTSLFIAPVYAGWNFIKFLRAHE